jgi:2-polyprenyl-6-methoxyphenol hydroxylase-like FAD-dependent oxidoreductase
METTCCIAGGGPAGAMLGLLLARAGIDVVVLEKHGDFLRDFRGDTVHPSTLDVLDELDLSAQFEQLEHRKINSVAVITDGGEIVLGDLWSLRGRHPYIAMVPQWDFLTMITKEATRYPGFRLLMSSEAHDLISEGGRVTGLRYRDEKGEDKEIRAVLTVAADGRGSVLRARAALPLKTYGAPMDVVWFRLPRTESDREDSLFRISSGRMMVALNRTSYWQIAYLVPKGGYAELKRSGGAAVIRRDVAELLPFLAGRTDEIDLDQVGVLSVRVDRLRRWYRPGLLCLGDAAHAMSPIGGVGINLAIQDAVAAANLLYGPLRRGFVRNQDLAAVQRRRQPPTAIVQAFQRGIQQNLIKPALEGREIPAPRALALVRRFTPLRRLMARFIGYGPLPEHVRIPRGV